MQTQLDRRSFGLGLLLVVSLSACDQLGLGTSGSKKKKKKKSDEDDDDDDTTSDKPKGKGKDDEGDDEAKAKASARAEEAKRAANIHTLAFVLGRKWGFACVFATLGNEAGVARNIKEADLASSALEVALPASPTKANAIDSMRSATLPAAVLRQHGKTAAAAYLTGVRVTEAFFGAGLDADISSQLADVEKYAREAGVPESVWKAPLAAARSAVKKGDAVDALGSALEAHYRK